MCLALRRWVRHVRRTDIVTEAIPTRGTATRMTRDIKPLLALLGIQIHRHHTLRIQWVIDWIRDCLCTIGNDDRLVPREGKRDHGTRDDLWGASATIEWETDADLGDGEVVHTERIRNPDADVRRSRDGGVQRLSDGRVGENRICPVLREASCDM